MMKTLPAQKRKALADPLPNSAEALYQLYSRKVYQRCLMMTKNVQQAEDFTHDIFLKVIANLHTFEHRSSHFTWLSAITYNYCLDQLRQKKHQQNTTLTLDIEQHLVYTPDEPKPEEPFHTLSAGLALLSSTEQKIVMMKYQEGLDIKTISAQLNISISAVKMRLKRIRGKLHKYYVQHTPKPFNEYAI